MQKSPSKLTEALTQALDFTPDELDLNRSGRLSKRQRFKLRQYHGWGSATTLSELLAVKLIDVPLWWLVALLRRASGKEVKVIEGSVRVEGYRLYIGERTFDSSVAVMKSFVDGANYRLYYDAHPTIFLPKLVSGEAL